MSDEEIHESGSNVEDLPFDAEEDASYWDWNDIEQAKKAKPIRIVIAILIFAALVIWWVF